MTDVVVVGGGLVGSSLAYELACAGARVTLFDASHPGRASDAGAGIISPETFAEPDEPWSAFGVRAARHLRELIARLAADGAYFRPETFAQCGSLVVALADHEDRWFSEVRARVTARAPEIVEVSDDEARAMFPPLRHVSRALFCPSAARLDGRGLTAAVREAAQRRGVTVLAVEADGVDRQDARVTAVRGGHHVVPCDAVVLAGGAWSHQVAPWLGIDLPVSPTKGQIVHVTVPDQSTAGSTDHWPIVQPVFNFYLVPWPGGRVACGGTFEADAGFDARPTAAGLRDLLRECVSIAPGLADATLGEVRVGLRPTSADDRPLLGPLPATANVHVCTGHGANGLLLGPYSAAVVTAGILGSDHVDRDLYPVARFFSAP